MWFTVGVTEIILKKDIETFLYSLLEKGIALGASDVHVDPGDGVFGVRVRVAGILHNHGCFYDGVLEIFIGKIKVLAGLRSDVHDRSQDGRFPYISKNKERVDVRVSIMPTFFGENCVLRLLRPEIVKFKSFKDLGMIDSQINVYTTALKRSSGLVIVAGPTGSGKTSTLYATLQYLSESIDDGNYDNFKPGKNIITIEDPVEVSLPGIRQIQVNSGREFGFKEALKGILRQDPDILMIGEIRDKETALAAIQTSLTGHLVLATIHAANVASIAPRLIDMGIEPYLLSSSVSMMLSQRLVRSFDYDIGMYGDRRGVFEVVPVDDEIRGMICKKNTAQEIDKYLHDSGYLLLRNIYETIPMHNITNRDELLRTSLDTYL